LGGDASDWQIIPLRIRDASLYPFQQLSAEVSTRITRLKGSHSLAGNHENISKGKLAPREAEERRLHARHKDVYVLKKKIFASDFFGILFYGGSR
jgi:hypothetical protein